MNKIPLAFAAVLVWFAQAANASVVVEACTTCPTQLPDVTTTSSFINITQHATIADVDLFIDISHTWADDLDIFLIKDATSVEITTDNGGATDNIVATFDDEAATSVTAVSPITGILQPEGLLSAFDGIDMFGTWELQITDDTGGDIGTLNFWELTITTVEGSAPVPATVMLLGLGLLGLGLRRRRG